MEIKKQVILRTVAGESMLIPVGDMVFQYNGIFRLSETGKQLWEKIAAGEEKDNLVDFLQAEYGLDFETADEDVTAFLNMLREYGII